MSESILSVWYRKFRYQAQSDIADHGYRTKCPPMIVGHIYHSMYLTTEDFFIYTLTHRCRLKYEHINNVFQAQYTVWGQNHGMSIDIAKKKYRNCLQLLKTSCAVEIRHTAPQRDPSSWDDDEKEVRELLSPPRPLWSLEIICWPLIGQRSCYLTPPAPLWRVSRGLDGDPGAGPSVQIIDHIHPPPIPKRSTQRIQGWA